MVFSIDFDAYRIVDLSFTVVPPGTQGRPFVVQRGRLSDNAYKFDIVRSHTHVGTHVEAPAHFYLSGKDVTQLPLDAFFGRAVLLDVPDAAAAQQIDPAFLDAAIGDILQPADIVVCRNSDREAEHAPCFTPQAAMWLRDHKIKMLGIDNYVRLAKDIPSGRRLHDILMSDDVCFIEWLDNLAALKRTEFYFMALPFKVRQMDSSWARAIAIEET